MYSFTGDASIIDEATMNRLLTQESFDIAPTGAVITSHVAAGVAENDIANYSYAIKISITAAKTIGRIELEVNKDLLGADMAMSLVSGFNPSGTADGTILISETVPKEFIPLLSDYISFPICETFTAQDTYLIVNKAGDATNNTKLMGEASASATYPVYRRAGTTGAWSASNSIHFAVYDNDFSAGDGQLIHEKLSDTAYVTNFYGSDGILESQQRYIKAADNSLGIRETMTYTKDSSGFIIGGDLS